MNALNQKYPGLGLFLIRNMLAVVFVFHGAQKLFGVFGGGGIEGTAAFFGQIGIPLPTLNAYMAGGAEFFGGLALATGILWRPGAALLVVTMLVASFTAHSGFSVLAGGMEYPLTLAVVTLGVGLAGPGAYTLSLPRTAPVEVATAQA